MDDFANIDVLLTCM